jgi:hypothetical protein
MARLSFVTVWAPLDFRVDDRAEDAGRAARGEEASMG